MLESAFLLLMHSLEKNGCWIQVLKNPLRRLSYLLKVQTCTLLQLSYLGLMMVQCFRTPVKNLRNGVQRH